MPTDEELMVFTAKGDLAAFEEIIRRHQHSAWNIAYRYYQPKATFKTYLYCVISRLCLDQVRKKQLKFSDNLPQEYDPMPSADERLLTQERDRLLFFNRDSHHFY